MANKLCKRAPASGKFGSAAVLTIVASTGVFSTVIARNLSRPSTQAQNAHTRVAADANLYEDGSVSFVVPVGWHIEKTFRRVDDPAQPHPPAVPETFVPGPDDGILLTTNGYTLTLAYRASHASPLAGGRFVEVFRFPWLEDVSDEWRCDGYLEDVPRGRPKSFRLFDLVFKQPDSAMQTACAIPPEIAGRRWFGAYFNTARGHYYFDSEGSDCPQKAYTLTSSAVSFAELPDPSDSTLRSVIDTATKLVSSIHYKSCPPASLPR
jgi:hypothetical protein